MRMMSPPTNYIWAWRPFFYERLVMLHHTVLYNQYFACNELLIYDFQCQKATLQRYDDLLPSNIILQHIHQ